MRNDYLFKKLTLKLLFYIVTITWIDDAGMLCDALTLLARVTLTGW